MFTDAAKGKHRATGFVALKSRIAGRGETTTYGQTCHRASAIWGQKTTRKISAWDVYGVSIWENSSLRWPTTR